MTALAFRLVDLRTSILVRLSMRVIGYMSSGQNPTRCPPI
jgi:hypothetical protein